MMKQFYYKGIEKRFIILTFDLNIFACLLLNTTSWAYCNIYNIKKNKNKVFENKKYPHKKGSYRKSGFEIGWKICIPTFLLL